MAERKKRTKLQRAHLRLGGFNALRRNLRKFGVAMGEELGVVARKTGERVYATAVASLRQSSTPSAPGQPPGMDTGELMNSVRLVILKRSVRVGTAARQGFYAEFGTRSMKRRPWLFPALRAHRQFYESELKMLSDRAMREIKPGDD